MSPNQNKDNVLAEGETPEAVEAPAFEPGEHPDDVGDEPTPEALEQVNNEGEVEWAVEDLADEDLRVLAAPEPSQPITSDEEVGEQ